MAGEIGGTESAAGADVTADDAFTLLVNMHRIEQTEAVRDISVYAAPVGSRCPRISACYLQLNRLLYLALDLISPDYVVPIVRPAIPDSPLSATP